MARGGAVAAWGWPWGCCWRCCWRLRRCRPSPPCRRVVRPDSGPGRAAGRGQPELQVRPRGLPGQGGLQDLRPAHLGGEQGEAGVRPRSGTPPRCRRGLGPGRASHRPQSESEIRRRTRGVGRAGRAAGLKPRCPRAPEPCMPDRRPGPGWLPRGGENVAAVSGARASRSPPPPRVASRKGGEGAFQEEFVHGGLLVIGVLPHPPGFSLLPFQVGRQETLLRSQG